MRSVLLAGFAVWTAGCLDVRLPDPPGPPQPGTLSGRVVIAEPGRSERVPVKDAEVLLLGSGLSVRSDATGAFLLSGITKPSGKVLVRADRDGNGSFEKQKLLSLEALRAGPGKSIALGDVLLGDNARLEGKVLRGDVTGSGGHAGSLAFVPEGPFTALSADDGTFSFTELPEGVATIAVFRAGYRAREIGEVQLSAGQTLVLRPVTLSLLDGAEVTMVRLSGRVVTLPDADVAGATIELASGTGSPRSASASSTGEFSFTVTPGLYSVTVRLAGHRTVIVSNVVVQTVDRDLGSIIITSGSGTVGGAGGGGTAGGAGGGSSGGTAGGVSGGSAGGVAGGSAGGIAGGSAGGIAGGSAGGIAGGSAGGIAGGSAGGAPPLPVVIVDPRTFVRTGGLATLDATRSFDPLDAGALSFRWIERTDAGVMLSANDSALAAAPTFTAPSTPRVLAFDVHATSARGTTASGSTVVEVLAPPVARVSPSTLIMRTGSTSIVSAAASTDPLGAPLSYAWSVVAGNVTLSTMSGPSVTITAPALPGAASVRLIVSNSVGIASDPVVVPINVSTTAVPMAMVSVSPAAQVAGPRASVVLMATASSTNSAEGFSFSWAQTAGGGPLVLTGASTATLGFVTPSTPGRLTLTVTATGDAGAVGMAVATVDVEDNVSPLLVSSDPPAAPNAAGGWYSLTATFDEALDPASINATTVSLLEGSSTPVPVDVRLEGAGQTIRVTPRVPLIPGNPYTLTLGALTDASPARNPFAGRALPFNARPPRFTRWSYSNPGVVTSLFPGVAVSSTQAWVVARDWTGTGYGAYGFEPNFEDGGLTRPRVQIQDTSAGIASRRGHVVNDVPHVLMPGNRGRTSMRTGPGAWAPILGAGEASIATDGTRLVGLYENYGPHWVTFTSPSSAPLDDFVENYIGSSPAWVSLNQANEEGSFTVAVSGTNQFLVLPTQTRSWRAYLKQGAAAWQNLTSTAPLPGPGREARATFNGATPVFCYVHVPTSGRQLSCSAWNGSSQWNHLTDLGPGTVESLDLFTRGPVSWLTFAAGQRIFVKWLRVSPPGGTLSVSTLNGPTGIGQWSPPGCVSGNPESFATADALYVAWEENCGTVNGIALQRVQ